MSPSVRGRKGTGPTSSGLPRSDPSRPGWGRVESRPDVDIRRVDEMGKSDGINITTGPQLYVTPALARSLQQTSRVLQRRTEEEANVDVVLVCVDVAEARITDAGGRTPVVHEFAHVIGTSPHAREPGLYERPQIRALRAQPGIDRAVVLYGRREAQDVVHRWPPTAMVSKRRSLRSPACRADRSCCDCGAAERGAGTTCRTVGGTPPP